jgi:SpoVK/Ycf46/Vps4 family AAA+-type ATPase
MDKRLSKSQQFILDLNTKLNSRMSVWVVTTEEERFFKLLSNHVLPVQLATTPDFQVLSWSCSEGLFNMNPKLQKNENGISTKPTQIMRPAGKTISSFGNLPVGNNDNKEVPVKTFRDTVAYASEQKQSKWFVLKDLQNFFDKNRVDYPETVRLLRDMVQYVRNGGGNVIILGSHADEIPADIANEVHVMDMPRPDDGDIDETLSFILSKLKKNNTDLNFCIDYVNLKGETVRSKNKNSKELRQKFIYNLRGLTEIEIWQTVSFIIVKHKGLEESALEEIKETKKEKISRLECLEYIPAPVEMQVGGHDDFKEYIDQRGLYLDPALRAKYNLKPPKGTLAVGISGSGKSVLAKYIGYKWGLPLIRMDMAAIYGQWLGQSESRLREALSLVEANAPCILWVDEIEKGLRAGPGDSGTSNRILGKLLTWMAERDEMIYMYCTANNIAALPTEFLRTGRFDTIRWSDLPTLNECKEILNIHCKLNGLSLNTNDISELAELAVKNSLTGAEIEQAIIEANYNSARQATKMNGLNVPAPTKAFLEQTLGTVKSFAKANEELLLEARKRALKDYQFTSEAMRNNVANLVAMQTEHTK